MARESNDGVSHLMALKQSASGVAASEPSGAATRGEDVKRRSPRYKVRGSAEMREEGATVRAWASFSDVSMHGCYVEAAATYPVGTAVRVRLVANGFHAQARGTVRVSHPCVGMGIAFTEVSEPDRAQLKDLLRTLSRPSVILGAGISSSLSAPGLAQSVPLITNPLAAVQAVLEFFEGRHVLTRDEFLAMLRKSQTPGPAR